MSWTSKVEDTLMTNDMPYPWILVQERLDLVHHVFHICAIDSVASVEFSTFVVGNAEIQVSNAPIQLFLEGLALALTQTTKHLAQYDIRNST